MAEHNLDITTFETYLKLRDGREITIARHIRCIKEIFEGIPEFTFDAIKEYLDHKKLTGTSNMTLRNYVSTIRLYARSKKLDEKISRFPLDDYPRVQGIVRRTLPDEIIEKFLNVPYRGYMSEERHKLYTVFWSIISFTALRPGECARLQKSRHIDLLNKQIYLTPDITKNGEPSTLPLFPNIFPIIAEYVKNLEGDWLFPSRHGGKYDNGKEPVIGASDWGDDFKARLEQIGVEKTPDLVPYSLRHSCATRWIGNDMNFYKVRRLMRHKKMEQTLVYEHMTSQHLRDTVVKHDPLVRKYANPEDVLDSAAENLENYGVFKDDRFSDDFKKKLRDLFYDEGKRLRHPSSTDTENTS